jgi:hypothetical protein
MKAILEFTLPEEREEHEMALNGCRYKIALEEMFNYFRQRLKYEELDDRTYKALEKAREEFIQITEGLLKYK